VCRLVASLEPYAAAILSAERMKRLKQLLARPGRRLRRGQRLPAAPLYATRFHK